jgi:hypothetical protein
LVIIGSSPRVIFESIGYCRTGACIKSSDSQVGLSTHFSSLEENGRFRKMLACPARRECRIAFMTVQAIVEQARVVVRSDFKVYGLLSILFS